MTNAHQASASAHKLALATILLTVFIVPTGIAGVAITLPAIARDLGASPFPLQNVVNGFNVAFALFTLVWGAASDRVGYRTTFVGGAALTVIASVVSAMAPSLLILDLARVVAGVAAAAIFTSAASLITHSYEGAIRARNFALFGTTLGLGLAAGPALAGFLAWAIGWRGVYVAFAVVAAVSLGFARYVPRIRHAAEPGRRLLDISLLRNRRLLAISLVTVAQAIGFITMLTYFPIALSAIYGLDAGQSGLLMLTMTVPTLLGPGLGARAVSRLKRVSLMGVVFASIALMIAGDLWVLCVAFGAPLPWVVPGLAVLGLSFGLPLGLLDGAAQAAVNPRSSGSAAGVLNFFRLSGEAIAVGAYVAALSALLRIAIPEDPDLANEIASGLPGYAATFAPKFAIVGIGIAALVVITAAVAMILERGYMEEAPRPAT